MGALNLPPRLAAVANMVVPGAAMADIGTDHGYLAAWLVSKGICPRGVASDRFTGPLSAAYRTIAALGLSGRVELRLGDGLSVLAPGEVATAVMAGFGGCAMQRVLAEAPAVLNCLARLVLQPNGGPEGLRRWLAVNGWMLVDEALVREGGRIYVAMAAEKGNPGFLDETDLMLGPLLWRRRHPLVDCYAREEYLRWQRVLEGMVRAREPHPERTAVAQRKVAVLAAALQEVDR